MKKSFSFLLLVLIAALTLTACGNSFKAPQGVNNEAAAVVNNGTMAVEKGGYLYFVNGAQTYTEDNTFGTPEKGAIMRIKLNDDGTPVVAADEKGRTKANTGAEVIVPKIYYNANKNCGIYIFENRIYYTTPSLKKDTDGNVWTSYLDVFSCSLTGTDTVEIATINSNSYNMTFWQAADKTVYLVYANGTEAYSINASAKKPTATKLAEKIQASVLGEDGNLYYTQQVEKTGEFAETGTYEAYNKLFKVSFAGGEATEIKDKNDKELTYLYNYNNNTYAEQAELSVTPIAATEDGTLYFTRNDTVGSAAATTYYCLKSGEIYYITSLATLSNVNVTTIDGTEALVCTYTSTTNTATIKTMSFKRQAKSIFASDYNSSDVAGLTNVIMTHSAAPTMLYIEEGKLYYLENSRVAVIDITYNVNENPVFEVEYLSENAVNTTFLKPTVVKGVLYFFNTTDDYSYTGYCAFTTTDEDGELKDVRVGNYNTADAEAYAEDLAEEDEEDEKKAE